MNSSESAHRENMLSAASAAASSARRSEELLKKLVDSASLAPTEEQIKHMVNRFLMWKLPRDFHPDHGISFKNPFPHLPQHWPVGTNLFNAEQAERMVRHMLEGLPPASQGSKP